MNPFPRPMGGFTLLEVMVTMLLIGIVTGFAVLTIPQRASPVEEESRRLQALLDLARQEAILRGRPRGVRFNETGYSFLAPDDQSGWLPLEGSLRPRELPGELSFELFVEGRPVFFDPDAENPPPQIVLLAGGEITEFTAILHDQAFEARPAWRLQGDLVGNLTLGPLP
ncbi:MAG: type II secretion system minor pseudopilin GspH [Candidatus Competibacteraceae bacterium]|nr:type II secretion system minor pseudopilin GspH [Candidatus Competibacteraceae bacterium]